MREENKSKVKNKKGEEMRNKSEERAALEKKEKERREQREYTEENANCKGDEARNRENKIEVRMRWKNKGNMSIKK